MVKITILAFESALRIRRAASNPPITGILISRIIKSGFNAAVFSTASFPFATSAHTSQPAAVRAERKPRRTASWSSAIRIRMDFSPTGEWPDYLHNLITKARPQSTRAAARNAKQRPPGAGRPWSMRFLQAFDVRVRRRISGITWASDCPQELRSTYASKSKTLNFC
jgi:hypothetical protein